MSDEKKILEQRLTDPEQRFLYNLAVKNFKTANYQRALPVFQFLVLEDNNNYLYLKSLAACYYSLKEYWMALATYEQCLLVSSAEERFECLYYMGMCHFELTAYAAAKVAFDNFLDSSPTNATLIKKARLYLEAIGQMDLSAIDGSDGDEVNN